jgi:hypothetical protein
MATSAAGVRVVGVALELARLPGRTFSSRKRVRRRVLELERFDARRDEPRHRVQDLLVVARSTSMRNVFATGNPGSRDPCPRALRRYGPPSNDCASARTVVAPDDVGHVGDRQGPPAGKPASCDR